MNRLFVLSIDFARALVGFVIFAALPTVCALAQAPGTFRCTGSMTTVRYAHTATLLKDGRVLIAGGLIAYGSSLASAEVYDPSTGTFTPTGDMTAARSFHAAALLSDGRVLIVGGLNAAVTAEVYDPAAGTFTATGTMAVRRNWISANLLSNGTVLITGDSPAETYNPATGVFTPAGSFLGGSAVVLQNGRVLIAGGTISVYDINAGSLQLVSTFTGPKYGSPTATLLADGKVLTAGGGDWSFATDEASLYDPQNGTLKATGPLKIARDSHTATLLPSGRVLITGGYVNDGNVPSALLAEEYDPSTGKFTDAGSDTVFRALHTATLLPDGTVLITGGSDDATAEIYVPPLRALSAASLPSGMAGTVYASVPFSAVGGLGGYVWSATGLPSGMTLSVDGVLSGTPALASAGAYSPLFTVTDSGNATASVKVSLIINAPPPSISSVGPNPLRGLNGNQTLFINGSGFQNGAGLIVRVTQPGGQIDLPVTFNSSDQLSISIDTGTAAANWTVQVINPDGQSSSGFSLQILPPSTTTSLALPHFVFGGAWYTALYFANTTDLVAHVQVNFYGNDGAPLNVPLVGSGFVSSRTIDLSPHSTEVLEALNGGISGEGWVDVSLPLGVMGHAVFRQTVVGRADQEAVVPLTPETSRSADLTYDDVDFTTSVAFLNPTGETQTVTVSTFDAAGALNGTAQQVLNPRSKVALVLKTTPGLAGISGHRGRAVFSVSNGAVSVLGLRFGGSAFTSIPVTHQPATPETRTISFAVPQMVFGEGWYTALYFSNTTNAVVNVPVNFTGDGGSPLAVRLNGIGIADTQTVSLDPRATAILEAPLTDAPGQGWAEATLAPGVIGYAVLRQTVPGRLDQEAVAPLTPESSQTADLIYDDIAFTTSVAFLNPSSQATTVAITVYSANGSQIGTTQVALPSHAKVATVLKSQPGLSGIAGHRGWATFSVPNGDISVLGLRFGGEAFTSIPVNHR